VKARRISFLLVTIRGILRSRPHASSARCIPYHWSNARYADSDGLCAVRNSSGRSMSLKLIPVPAKSKRSLQVLINYCAVRSAKKLSKTCSIGMAKPIPCVPTRTAVLTPRTCPASLINGPPLLPGLIGASVCRNRCLSSSPNPEKIPEVTVHFETRRISNGVQTIALAHFAGTCVLEIGTGTRRELEERKIQLIREFRLGHRNSVPSISTIVNPFAFSLGAARSNSWRISASALFGKLASFRPPMPFSFYLPVGGHTRNLCSQRFRLLQAQSFDAYREDPVEPPRPSREVGILLETCERDYPD